MGLRNTLEPDPDNTGVGSFGSEVAFLFESWRRRSCFIRLKTRGPHAQSHIHYHQPRSMPFLRVPLPALVLSLRGFGTFSPRGENEIIGGVLFRHLLHCILPMRALPASRAIALQQPLDDSRPGRNERSVKAHRTSFFRPGSSRDDNRSGSR